MDHFKHDFTSASSLGSLNTGGARLVKAAIRAGIARFRESTISKPIRLLDIGCGQSPYLNSDEEILQDLSVTLVDINDDVLNKHWLLASPKYHKDFFDLTGDGSTTECHPYHIIVLAGVLHELRAQLALQALNPTTDQIGERQESNPEATILKRLAEASFVGPDTVIILSDLFHWRFWDADKLDEARRYQFENFKHADPASAFLPGEEVVRHALYAGFELIAYDEAASVDPSHVLCSHQDYGLIYRSRRAFCSILKRNIPSNNADEQVTNHPSISSVTQRRYSDLPEVIREGIAAKREEQEFNHHRLSELQKLLATNTIIERPSYDELLGKGLFHSLAKSAGQLARDWFATTQVSCPEALMFWFGVNSMILEDRDGRGYALQSPDGREWVCHKVYLKDPDVRVEPEIDQDWCALCFNTFASPVAIKDIASSHGWLNKLPPPSIYRWMTTLSDKNPAWRSVSVFSLSQADIRSTQSPARLVEDALVLQHFRPHTIDEDGHHGHTLISLPGDPDVAHTLGFQLDQKCSASYCSEGKDYVGPHQTIRNRVLCAISAVYLDSLFLARGHAPNKEQIKSLVDKFKDRWLNNPKIKFFDSTDDVALVKSWVDGEEEIVILPARIKDHIHKFVAQVEEYPEQIRPLPAVWTCFIVRQPGASSKPIATIMLMSDRPCNPALLELFMAQFEEVFFSIREVEVTRIERQHAAALTTQSMLGSLGHDGKRPAEIIRQVLLGESGLSLEQRIAAAASISVGLISRLSGYTRLIDDGSSQDEKHLTAWREGQVDSVSRSCSIRSIFESELALTLLRLAVDSSGKWPDLRRKLEMEGLVSSIIDAYPKLDSILAALKGKVQCNFNENKLETPEVLISSTAETTNPRVFHALHFLFAEILTNAFRHEFSHPALDANQLNITLSVIKVKAEAPSHMHGIPTNAVLADFCCTMQPSLPETHRDVITGSTHGLDSIANVAKAIGASVGSREIEYFNPEVVEWRWDTPRAFFLRKNASIIWNLSDVPCFLGE